MTTTALPSTRPYLIRALHEWCMENGFTPYLAVAVDGTVRVPAGHVVNGEIVLNVSTDATSTLVLGNEFIDFKARFGGVPQDISVPVGRVLAIYARENGQGMAFPIEFSDTTTPVSVEPDSDPTEGKRGTPGLVLVGVDGVPDGGAAGGEEMPPKSKSGGKSAKSKPTLKRIK